MASAPQRGVETRVLSFGKEAEPVVVMDGFTGMLDGLLAEAARQDFARTHPHYPGVRAKAPLEVLRRREKDLSFLAREVFGADGLGLVSHEFSVVTTLPGELKPVQSLPHFDGLVEQLALLIYLRPAGQGGTAFFRQKATGFETVTKARFYTYEAELRRAVGEHGMPEGYFGGTDELFEEIGRVEAVPDRAVLYRGRTLHSGVIEAPDALSADPTVGRLTVNTFFRVS